MAKSAEKEEWPSAHLPAVTVGLAHGSLRAPRLPAPIARPGCRIRRSSSLRAPQLLRTSFHGSRTFYLPKDRRLMSRALPHPQRTGCTVHSTTAALLNGNTSTTTPTVKRHNQHKQPVRRTGSSPVEGPYFRGVLASGHRLAPVQHQRPRSQTCWRYFEMALGSEMCRVTF